MSKSSSGERKSSSCPRQVKKRPDTGFTFRQYASNRQDLPGWVDPFFDWLGLPVPITAVIIAGALFAVGYGIAYGIGFTDTYLRTLPVYLGCFGTACVSIVLRYSSAAIHGVLEALRPCFLVSDAEFRMFVTSWLASMWSRMGNAAAAAFFVCAAAFAVHSAFYGNPLVHFADFPSLRPSTFGAEWYTPTHLHFKALIIFIFGSAAGILLGPACRVLLINVRFLLALRTMPIMPLAEVIRSRLRPTILLYLSISLSWFIGVALFAIVLFHELDELSIALLGVLSLLGTIMFLVPQVVFRSYLARTYRYACDQALCSALQELGITLDERRSQGSVAPLGIEHLAAIGTVTDRPKGLVYDPMDLMILVIGQVVALASIFADTVVAWLTSLVES